MLVRFTGVLAVLLIRYAPAWMNAGSESLRAETALVFFVADIMAYSQGFVYAWNLGYRLDAT